MSIPSGVKSWLKDMVRERSDAGRCCGGERVASSSLGQLGKNDT